MKRKALSQTGFHVIEVVIVIFVIGLIGFAGYKVLGKKKEAPKSVNDSTSQQVTTEPETASSEQPVLWQMGAQGGWAVAGGATAPACPEPMTLDAPVDMTKVESILYPGQTRGGHYKAHGGLGMIGSNKHEVRAPTEGYLSGGVRYIEAGELQYKFEYTHPCGIRYMFDHLKVLSPAMEKVLSTMPEAKVDETRTNWQPEPIKFNKGDLIAVEVGHTGNPGFDFGLYDLRQRNEASKDAGFAAKHQNEGSQAFYAVCWFDWLSSENEAKVRALPSRDQKMGKTSDYCKG